MVGTGRPLSELWRGAMERVPQVLENVTLSEKRPLPEMPRLARLSAEVEKALGEDGRLLVRWSGTEPKLRIMIEGPDAARIAAWAKDLAAAARGDVPAAS
jgi:phosphoglucosamine mutase